MKTVRSNPIRVGLFVGLLFGGFLMATGQQSAAPAPDNTKMNAGDQTTADQQKEQRSDRDITKQIRQAIIHDKSLSTYAHNVKIITQDGVVTIKGPVRSEEEKKAVEAKAVEVAGEGKVNNQLDIKPKE